MQFATQLRRARLTFAIIMASTTCIIMSAVTTSLLTPLSQFWSHWPHVLLIDLVVANPTAILLSPLIRRLCHRLYPDLKNN